MTVSSSLSGGEIVGTDEAAVDGEFLDFTGPEGVAAGGGVVDFELHDLGAVGDGGAAGVGQAALEGQQSRRGGLGGVDGGERGGEGKDGGREDQRGWFHGRWRWWWTGELVDWVTDSEGRNRMPLRSGE